MIASDKVDKVDKVDSLSQSDECISDSDVADVPSANETPSFCQRYSKEDAQHITSSETNRALMELGVKLQRDLSAVKLAKRNNNLDNLNEQVKLSEMLNEYFDLDEISKKARMLDLLSELNKLRTKNVDLSRMIDQLNRKYENEKDMYDEAVDQLRISDKTIDVLNRKIMEYIKNIDEMKTNDKKLVSKIEQLQFEKGMYSLFVYLFVLYYICSMIMGVANFFSG